MIVRSDALIVVDVQRDFCAGGALAVPDGDAVVPVINELVPKFPLVVYTRDWHPADHGSFSDEPEFVDGSWPAHCVAHTPGAQFHPDLQVISSMPTMSKGTEPTPESYSAFHDTDIFRVLRDKGALRLLICGLATDYCVRQTALDAVAAAFDVCVVRDACRAVDAEGTGKKALEDMAAAGVQFVDAAEVR